MAAVLAQQRPQSAPRARLERVALAGTLLGYGAWLYWQTRGTTFRQDEWAWLLYRRGNGLATFLRPHTQHLSLVPLVIYRLLLASVGARHYGPYRGLAIAEHMILAALVVIYARRRVGGFGAVAAGALVLCLGAGWGAFLWGFQITWLTSLDCGLGALLLLDHSERRFDGWACLLLAVSLASSGLGLPIALGAAVELLWGRQWRRLWVVTLPAVPYAVWWVVYQHVGATSTAGALPRFLADEVASTMAALVGVAGSTSGTSAGAMLTVGRPLAVIAALLAGWWLWRRRGLPARVLGLAAALGSFWILTAISRAYIGIPESWASRYLYVAGVFVVLLGIELAQGLRVPRGAQAVLALALAAIVISGSLDASRGARSLRAEAEVTRAELGAMAITRPIISPRYLSLVPYFPFPIVLAGPYFAAERAYGSPADTPAQIAASSPAARQAADAELVQIHHVRLLPLRSPGCRLGVGIGQRGLSLELPLPPHGLVLQAIRGSVTVEVRRFAALPMAIGRLSAGHAGLVRIGPDQAPQRWWVVVPSGSVAWCPARGPARRRPPQRRTNTYTDSLSIPGSTSVRTGRNAGTAARRNSDSGPKTVAKIRPEVPAPKLGPRALTGSMEPVRSKVRSGTVPGATTMSSGAWAACAARCAAGTGASSAYGGASSTAARDGEPTRSSARPGSPA
jgi:hypothetical protein